MTAFDGFGTKVSVFFDSDDADEIQIGTDNDCVTITARDARILIQDLVQALTVRGQPFLATTKDYEDEVAEAQARQEEHERRVREEQEYIARAEAPDRALGF